MLINLLHHAKVITSSEVSCLCNQHNYRCAFYLSCQSCMPKEIDLTSVLLLQLPYHVSVLLLTSGCKSALAEYKQLHNTNIVIIWNLYEVFYENKIQYKIKCFSCKNGHGTCITRLYKWYISSFSVDK